MTATRMLAAALCLFVAELPAQGSKPSPVKAPSKEVAAEQARAAAKALLGTMKASGQIFIHPASNIPIIPIHGAGTWQLAPVLGDAAFHAAFQKLQAAQQELVMADTATKARNALDKIEKALMEIRRALWKAEKEGRKLQPRPLPIFGGLEIGLRVEDPEVIIPSVFY